jgi:glucosyl-3-phosphoglycerate synthase
MSDFFQHGLISTLHRLNETSLIPDEGLSGAKLGLLLPCHFREIGTQALVNIIETLNCLSLFDHVIVSVNGTETPDKVVQFWSSLHQSHTIVWNDSPEFGAWLQQHNLIAIPGKGLNLWSGFGFALTQTDLKTLVIHDCDILNYKAQLPFSLAIPAARLGYQFCKGFYSRVRQQLYGRATRLFMIPLVRALTRTLGHMPLLDFIDSFRYPLSGERALSTALAGDLPVESRWAVEIGWLCEIHRLRDPQQICQVDLAMRYDHQHQTVDPEHPDEGLLGMVTDLALSILTQIEQECAKLEPLALESVMTGYRQLASDVIRRYRDVALFNALPFDEEQEQRTASLFGKRLEDAVRRFSAGVRTPKLPPWNEVSRETSFPVEALRTPS